MGFEPDYPQKDSRTEEWRQEAGEENELKSKWGKISLERAH